MTLLRVVDFETTGIAPPASVIEVGICDVIYDADGLHVQPWLRHFCGGGTITAETRAIHHISPAEIEGFDPFDAKGFMGEARHDGVAAIVAHHANFEAQWLGAALDGMPMICTYKSALRVWPDEPSHSNQFLRYRLEELGQTQPDAVLCQPAHRAGPDAYATAWTLRALLTHATVENLLQWTTEPALMPVCPIGKEKGKKWPDVDFGFLHWMMRQETMEADLKWNAKRELDRRAGK